MIPNDAKSAMRATESVTAWMGFLLSGYAEQRSDGEADLAFYREHVGDAFSCIHNFGDLLSGKHRKIHREATQKLYEDVKSWAPEILPGIN